MERLLNNPDDALAVLRQTPNRDAILEQYGLGGPVPTRNIPQFPPYQRPSRVPPPPYQRPSQPPSRVPPLPYRPPSRSPDNIAKVLNTMIPPPKRT